MVRRRSILAALGGAGISVAAVASGRVPGVGLDVEFPEIDTPGEPWDPEVARKEMHRLTNAARSDHDLATLDWNEDVAAAAQSYAETMAAEDHYGHVGPDGREPDTRVRQQAGCYGGENIAKSHWRAEMKPAYEGDATTAIFTPEDAARDFIGLWMHSDAHRENILRESHRTEGIGVARDHETYEIYAVQDFC
jgi:uncharacterized protein YkwD